MTQAIPAACKEALQAGDPDRALQLAIELLHGNKEDPAALAACYEAYRAKGDGANAAKVLEVVLKLKADTPWALAELATLHWDSGRREQAELLLRQAVESAQAPGRAHAMLGLVFSELNRLAAGEWHFRRALALGEETPTLWLQLGLNLARQERGEAAADCYAEAMKQAPRDIQTLGHAAKHAEVTGEFAEARRLLDRADLLQPGATNLLRATLLARTGKAKRALALLDSRPSLNGDGLLERGKLRDRLGDAPGAWDDWVAGKAKLAAEGGGLRYDRTGVEAYFSDLARALAPAQLADLPRAATRSDEPLPLFIMGAPRSGTTLLERLLAQHGDIMAGGELPFVAEWRVLLEKLLPERSFPDNLRALRAADQRHVVSLLRDQYLALRAELGKSAPGLRFVTDKMPFNEVYLPLVRLVFPDSPIILLGRDRRDVTVSMLANKLNHGFHCAYRVEDIVHHLKAVDELLAAYQAPQQVTLSLAYEDLVAAPEPRLRDLLASLELPFDPACLSGASDGQYVATPSYDQVGAAINTRAAGRHVRFQEQLAAHFPSPD